MSSVPLSPKQLEDIVVSVARDLLENWGVNDRFVDEDLVKVGQYSVDDTVFVINSFMEYFNQLMIMEAENKSLINLE